MGPAYAYTCAIWPPLGAAVLFCAVGVRSWHHARVRGARLLTLSSFLAVLWLVGMALVVSAVAPETKIAWHKFQAVWQTPVATIMTCVALEYAYPGRWLTRRNATLLAIPAFLITLLILVQDSHLVWRELAIRSDGWVVPHYYVGTLVLHAYGLALTVISVAALVWLYTRSPQHHWPAALMIAGQLAGRLIYLSGVLAPEPIWPGPVIAAVALPWATYAIVLFGLRIFDPLPAARETAYAQMRDGMVVLDADRRVASLNPAAAGMLGTKAAHARGKTLPEVCPDCPDISPHLAGGGAGSARSGPLEVDLADGSKARNYALDTSPLMDFRGLTIGYLLTLRDVTEERRARAQILEQQRLLAKQEERVQLARELHDGLGQVLGYVKLQAQASRDELAQGRLAEADRYLAQLGDVAQDAHADVREFIKASSANVPTVLSFRTSLEQYVQRFSENYATRVDLELPPGLVDDAFEPAVATQLLRIIQEALTNTRKHAHATQVRVSLAADDDMSQITIADDGQGFDAQRISTGGFGLRFMAERAQSVGGSLVVSSTPGQGTQLVVRVPLRKPEAGP